MAAIAECLFCNEILSPDDFRHGPKSTCPRCGNLIARPAPPVKAPSPPKANPPPGAFQPKPPRDASLTERLSQGQAGPGGVRPKPPPRPSVTGGAEEADEAAPEAAGDFLTELRRIDPVSLTVSLLGGAALLLASIPPVAFLTRPLSGLALLAALACLLTPSLRRQANRAVLAAIAVLSLFTWIFLAPRPQPRDPPLPTFVAVPLHNAGMVGFKPIQEDEWIDADLSAIQRDGVRVRVRSVKIGVVEMLKDDKPIVSQTEHLQIQVQVSYEGATRTQVPFETWVDAPDAPSKHPPTVTDNQQRPYSQVTFDRTMKVVARRSDATFLTLGRLVVQLLVYPAPPTEVEYFRLELPGAAAGTPGTFRFRIPWSMIERTN